MTVIVERLEAISQAEGAFEPARTQRLFSIACADCLAVALVPRIIARVLTAGPGLRVKFRPIDPAFDVATAMREGAVDLAIDNSPNPSASLHVAPLYDDDMVMTMRQGHPAAALGRPGLPEYLALQHLAPHPSSLTEAGPVDGALARAGHVRSIHATVAEFNLVPHVLMQTDLVFTTGRRFAEAHARHFPLDVIPAPDLFEPMRFYQLWHGRSQSSASVRWLRDLVGEAAREIDVAPDDVKPSGRRHATGL